MSVEEILKFHNSNEAHIDPSAFTCCWICYAVQGSYDEAVQMKAIEK